MSDYLELLGTSGEHNYYMGDNSVALCDYCSQYSLEKHIGEIIVRKIDVQVHNFILGAGWLMINCWLACVGWPCSSSLQAPPNILL